MDKNNFHLIPWVVGWNAAFEEANSLSRSGVHPLDEGM